MRFKELAAQAWLGSWLGTLPAVRALAGPQLASSEEVTQGSAGWAGALHESVEELAAEGVHLDHTGSVGAEPPALPWRWDDSAPALAQRQRLLFRRPVERLRELLVNVLVEEHGYSKEEAEAAVVLGAYLDDVVVGVPAQAAARVPGLAAQAFAPVGCLVEQQKAKVWVPAGLCPAG